jgi:hypothetical protein
MLADREGRIEDRPARIKKQALGYDNGNADEMLSELAKAGFIERYEVDGFKVIQILAFNKHQTPHIREAASELPSKEAGTTKAVQSTNQGSAEHSPRSPDSPFPLPDTGYLIADTPTPSAHEAPTACVTEPGKVCKAMKAAGIGDVNPGHPDLLMLLNAGATVAEFTGAATTAAKKGKGFAYALGTLKRTRQDAANTAQTLHAGPLPVTTVETDYQRSAREKMTGWAPSIAAKAPGQPQPITVLEAEHVAAIGSH